MKICLYFESEKLLAGSGIGRARRHQMQALESVGIEYTTDPKDDFDILHINTFGVTSASVISKAHKENKHVIYHAHSTEEDFRNSFILSNQIAPLFKIDITSLYSSADSILTTTPYSKSLLEAYGITLPITAISNGIDLKRFSPDAEKIKAFRKYFSLHEEDKVVLSVGLYFERKGIMDFMEVARRMPEYKFIWFGHTNLYGIPKNVRDAIIDSPTNVILPGYVKGAIIEGAYADADVFFFPSYEETEGIVVLEALASKCKTILRDIGVYDPWLKDKVNCYKGKTNEDFVRLIKGCVENTLPELTKAGYETAKERSIPEIGKQLKEIYRKVQKLPIRNVKGETT
ncbi:MAG: glycosyltransferase [Erysipelotrichales bacterium]|nr:MAG: glycosyltransferase [Erysipelotrichales bacterium]